MSDSIASLSNTSLTVQSTDLTYRGSGGECSCHNVMESLQNIVKETIQTRKFLDLAFIYFVYFLIIVLRIQPKLLQSKLLCYKLRTEACVVNAVLSGGGG